MNWRPLGKSNEPFPLWVRSLRNKSGVYAIRKRGFFSSKVLYVGESHTGGLYKTLTRHFQQWHRSKQFWRGGYSPTQTDPGHTYERGDVEVAVVVLPRAKVLDRQASWIERLKPRDNVHDGNPDEKVPF